MIGLLRRVAFALSIAAGASGVLRLIKPPPVPMRTGGWRPLTEPSFR
jgi:hypothetical protein